MLTLIILLGLAAIWLAGSLVAVALCVAARRGDEQQVVDDDIIAGRVAADRSLVQALSAG